MGLLTQQVPKPAHPHAAQFGRAEPKLRPNVSKQGSLKVVASSVPTCKTPATDTSTPGRSHMGLQVAALKLSYLTFVQMGF